MRRVSIAPKPRDVEEVSPSLMDWFNRVTDRMSVQVKNDWTFTVDDIPEGQWAVHHNKLTGDTYLVANVGGVLKKTTLT